MMKQEIFSLVRERDFVSFTELAREIPGFEGEMALYGDTFPNVIFWPWVSQEGADALGELIEAKKIFIVPTVPFTYMIGGRVPVMPVARTEKQYAKPHWLPVTLSKSPPRAAKGGADRRKSAARSKS